MKNSNHSRRSAALTLSLFLFSLLSSNSFATQDGSGDSAAKTQTKKESPSSEAVTSDWALESSKIEYTVRFPLKTVRGDSTQAKGKGHCEKDECEFLVAAPIRSFQSGDANRDSHMWEVTKAGSHPMVSARYKFALHGHPKTVKARIDVDFAGKKQMFENVPVHLSWRNGQVDTETEIPLILSHFEVERPRLLGVAIDDSVPVHLVGHWTVP